MVARARLRERELYEIGVEGGRPVAAPSPRALASVLRGVAGGATALVVIFALALAAREPDPAPPMADLDPPQLRPEPTLLAPPPDWIVLDRPRITVLLDAPDFAGLPMRHVAALRADGARRDTLVFGTFAGPQRHLRLELIRPGAVVAEDGASAFLAMARVGARAGLAVARTGTTDLVETRLGPLEIAPVVLESGPVRDCLGFRGGTTGLALAGFLCAEAAQARDLACLVDGLAVPGTDGEPELAGLAAAPLDSLCPRRLDPERVAAIAAASASQAVTAPAAPIPPRRPTGN